MNVRARLRRLVNAARGRRLAASSYIVFSRLLSLRRNVVLMESHKGQLLSGNPYYLLRHLVDAGSFPNLRFVVVCSRDGQESLRKVLPPDRISYCRVDSLRYALHLATAEFLINDVSFPTWVSRREGQRYLNTWHGTPIKALGMGVSRGLHANLRNMQRNFLHATHLLFPNEHTENVLRRCFGLDALWRGCPVRCGYPRNDVLARRPAVPRRPGDAVHVAYMPTWRGTHETLATSAQEHIAEVVGLMRAFATAAPASLVLWVRLHPLMKGTLDFSDFRNVREFPGDVEAYEHLANCDALVTDYSSVMIDFAIGGGSVLLYTPDLQQYRKTQDFSLELSELPFPTYASVDDLLQALSELSGGGRVAASNELLAGLIEREDGRCSERVCETFFDRSSWLPCDARAATGKDDHVLILIERPLTADTWVALDSAVNTICGTGCSVVITTPGEAQEDPLLVKLAKQHDVTYCPSTVPGSHGASRLLGMLACPESRRLYASAGFRLVCRVGPCPSYQRLISEFPPADVIDVSLHDSASVAALLDRIEPIAGLAGGQRQSINVKTLAKGPPREPEAV